MLAYLRGQLIDADPERTVIDVGGVGYHVTCSRHTLAEFRPAEEAGRPVEVRIHTHVREGAITLYGFHRAAEEAVFLLLIGVHGIGPAIAIAILNAVGFDGTVRAVLNQDAKPFQAASGVGRKSALRIVNELQGKIPDHLTAAAPAPSATEDARRLAREALAELGFRDTEIEAALDNALRRAPDADAPALIRTVLAARGRRQTGAGA